MARRLGTTLSSYARGARNATRVCFASLRRTHPATLPHALCALFHAGKFCFHTAKTSHMLSQAELRRVLREMRDAGAVKLNIAGGEPFLYPRELGDMVGYAKQVGYDSVSIISNGSRISREWFERHGSQLDILGVSVDSIEPQTLYALGRWPRGGREPKPGETAEAIGQLQHVRRAAELSREFGVKFKLNTVVTSANDGEDLTPLVNEAKPMRWKIFQALPLEGENTGAGATKGHDVTPLLVDSARFAAYVQRAKANVFDASIIEAEDNATMQASYLLLDEYGRFLDSSQGGKTPTDSILEVGVEEAARQLATRNGFDAAAYARRGADYSHKWSRDTAPQSTPSCSQLM